MIFFIDDEQNSSLQITRNHLSETSDMDFLLIVENDLKIMWHDTFSISKGDYEQLIHRLEYPEKYVHAKSFIPSLNMLFGETYYKNNKVCFPVSVASATNWFSFNYCDHTGLDLLRKIISLREMLLEHKEVFRDPLKIITLSTKERQLGRAS
ncbi:MAG: hypothetical protein U0T74_00230 [Chitinophagales bacterium]